MAARKIGATISLDGADKFKSQVSNCNKELAAMKAELGKTKAEYDGNANSLEALTKKQSALEKTLGAAQKKQEAVSKALEAAQKAQSKAAEAVDKQKTAVDKAEKELEAYRKGTEKTAEGEKELERALATAQAELARNEKALDKAEKATYDWQTQQAKAQTETINLANALKENDRYLDEARSSSDGLATSIDEYGKKAKTAADNTGETVTAIGKLEGAKAVAEVMGDLAGKLGELSDKAIESAKAIDDGYDTIITKTGATGDALASFTGIADNIYGRLPIEMQSIGAAIGEVNTRFGLQGDELEKLSEHFLKFAEINGVDVSGSVDKVQKTLTAFGRDASSAGDLLDAMTKAGQDTGVGMDQLASSLTSNAAALQEMGLSLEDSVKFVAQLEKSGVDSSAVMSGLGKALKNAAKDGKGINTALSELQKEITDGTRDMDGLNASYELFGKNGAAIFNAVKNGSLDFRNLKNSVNDFSGVVDRTYESTLDAWDGWSVATNNLKGALSDLTMEGLETLTPAIEKVTDGAKKLKDGVSNLPGPLRKVVSVTMLVGGEIGKAAPKVMSFVAQLSQLKTASALASGAMGGGSTIGGGGLSGALSAFAGSAAGVGVLTVGIAAGIGAVAAAVINATGVLDGLDSRIGDVSGAADAMSKTLEGASSNLEQAMEDARSSVELSEATFGVATGLVDELENLANKTSRTADENARMKQIVGELNEKFPDLKITIDETTGALNMTTDSIRDFIEAAKESAMIEVYQEAIKNGYAAVFEAQTKVYESNQKLGEIEQTQAGIQKEIDSTTAAMQHNRDEAAQLQEQLTHGTFRPELLDQISLLDTEYETLVQDLAGLNDEMQYVNETHAAASEELNGFKADVAAAEGEITKYEEVMNQLKTDLQETATATEGVGEDVTAGFDIGMKKGQKQLETTAGNMGSSVIRNIRKTTGVASPSKFTTETGRYIAQGLINGQQAMAGFVQRSSQLLASYANVAAYANAYYGSAVQAGIQIAQGLANGLTMGRGLVAAASAQLLGAMPTGPLTTPVKTNGNINSTVNMTINGAGQNANQIADLVSMKINRQINSLRSARG